MQVRTPDADRAGRFLAGLSLFGVVAGDSISGEASAGTLRYLLVSPVSRGRLLLVKYAATVLLGLSAIAWDSFGQNALLQFGYVLVFGALAYGRLSTKDILS